MSKLFKRFSGITLGLALCFGFSFSCSNKQSSNQMARAEEAVYAEAIFNATNNKASVGSYSSTFTNETNGFSWTLTNFNNNSNKWSYVKCGSKNNASVGTIVTTSSVSDVITKAAVTIDAITANKVNSIKLYGGEDGTTELGSFDISTGEKELTIPSSLRDSDQVYKFAFDCEQGTGNGLVTVSSVKLYYEAATLVSSISLVSEYYEIVDDVITIEKGDGGGSNSDELTAVISPDDAEDKTVTWSSNNESVAQVDNGGYVLVDTNAVGQATITATANDGSGVSKSVTYSVVDSSAAEYDISTSVTNGSSSGAEKITEGTTATVTIAANNGYKLPSNVTVTNADLDSYNQSTGAVVISNPTGNVNISATCVALANYNISVDATNCTYVGDSTISEGGSATLTFTASEGYALPDTVTGLSGATETSWNKATGELVLSNPSSDVTVTMTAATFGNSTQLVPGDYYIAYNDGGTYHYISSVSGGKGATTTDKVQGLVFTFSLVGDNTWKIKNADKYLNVGSGSTSLTLDANSNGLTLSWENETNGTRVIKGASGRDLAWYASNSDIRTYSGKTDGTNGMTLISTVVKVVDGFSVYSEGANRDVLKDSTFDADAATAAGFQARLNYTDGTYDDVSNYALWELDTRYEGPAILTVTYQEYDAVVITDMNIYTTTFVRLTVVATGAKTQYTVGDKINTAGLVITGYDSLDNDYPIDANKCNFVPDEDTALSLSDTTVTVTFVNENGSEVSDSYSITVSEFAGFTKVTSVDNLTVGDSYLLGVDSNAANSEYKLMGASSSTTQSAYRNVVDGSSAFVADRTRVTKDEAIEAGACVVTLLSDGNGKYAFCDIGNDKYLAGKTPTSNSNYLYDNDSLSEAGDTAWWTISFEDGLLKILLNGTENRVLGYNSSFPRFSTYTNYTANTLHPVLFKMNGSDVKDAVTSFANNSLKMNDSNYDGDISTENCEANYTSMKTVYANLTDAQKNVLRYSDDYAAALSRLNNWAKANGQEFNYGNEEPFAALRKTGVTGDILSPVNDSSLIILFIICTLGAGALSAFYLMKKKKRA